MTIALLRAGARVALVSRGPSAPLDETLRRAALVAPPTQWVCAHGDLRDPGDCERVASEATRALGPVDVLVNNAAIPNVGEGEPFWRISTQDWVTTTRTNCDSVFFMSRAVAPGMIARGFGKIVNVSTSDRSMARPRFSPYGPSKAFVETCTRMWAKELEGTGVTMNVLIPGGAVDTQADLTGKPGAGKYQPAEVIAPALLWLASDASNGRNGEKYVANLWDENLAPDASAEAARQAGVETPRIL